MRANALLQGSLGHQLLMVCSQDFSSRPLPLCLETLSVLLLCHVVFVVTDFGATPWFLASPINNHAGFLSSQDELEAQIQSVSKL